MIAPCHFGLEAVLKKEIIELGYEILQVEDGRVSFAGDEEAVCRANLHLRTAERILIKIGSFPAVTFEELFQGTKDLPWESYIPIDGKFWVAKAASVKSKLFSPSDIQSIMKKAIVERLKGVYRVGWFGEEGASFPLRVFIMKDMVTVGLDTTGESLHKRGYRKLTAKAPIAENLAAALADYERAVELDETSVEAYLGLADIYTLQNDLEAAQAILERGYKITNDEIILSRLEQIYINRPDGASETITANGYIVDNMKEYAAEIEQIRELYFDREVNGTRHYNISSFGVRFTEPVNVLVSGKSVSLVEANFVFGNDGVFSIETPVASVVNQTIRVTGYFYKRVQTENAGENHEMYWPNGDYCFAITGYEQIE